MKAKAGRPKIGNGKRVYIAIRATAREKEQVRAEALKKKMGWSEYIRWRLYLPGVKGAK